MDISKKEMMMPMSKRTRFARKVSLICVTLFILIILAWSSSSHTVLAQNVPQRIRYIALLANPAGQPVEGTFTVIFTIYDAEEDGNLLYTEEHTDVVITKRDAGSFVLNIGSITPLTLSFSQPYWLEVEVISETGHTSGAFFPRKRILSAGVTINADQLDAINSLSMLRSDEDDEVSANLTITGYLYIFGDLTGAGVIDFAGVPQDFWIIDVDNDATRPALVYGDINNQQLYYSIPEDEFHLTDDLSMNGGLTINGFARFNGGIDVNNSRFTVSSVGDTHADGTLGVDRDATLNGNVDLGTTAADTVSIIGEIDSALMFASTASMHYSGDVFLLPVDDIEFGPSSSGGTVVSNELTVRGNEIYGMTMLALTFLEPDILITGNLTVDGTEIGTPTDFLINPMQDTSRITQMGVGAEGDSVYIDAVSTTISGGLWLSGAGNVLDVSGTLRDSFIIDTDDTTDTPTLAFRDSDGDEYFRWNDLLSSFELSDDLTFNSVFPLTVPGELVVSGSDYSRIESGRVYIGGGSPSLFVQQSGDLLVSGDAEIVGDLSIGGDLSLPGIIASSDGQGVVFNEDLTVKETLFVDTIVHDDQADLQLGNDLQFVTLDSIDWDIAIDGDMTDVGDITSDGSLYLTDSAGSPALSVSGSSQIGTDSNDVHRIRGATTFGTGSLVQISDAGDLTLSGSVQLGDYITDIFSLTSAALIVHTDGAMSDTDAAVLLDDDVSITGELSVGAEIEVFGNDISRFRYSNVVIGDDVSMSGLVTGPGDLYIQHDVEIGGTLSVAHDLTVAGLITRQDGSFALGQGDITVTGTVFVDRIDDEADGSVLFVPDITFQGPLTINQILYVADGLVVNPRQGQAGTVRLGGIGEGDNVQIDGSLSVSESVTVGGILYGSGEFADTASDIFMIDIDDSTDTPTLIFEDSDGDETFMWNDPVGEFQMTDNLSVGGALTIEKLLLVQGSGRSQVTGTGHTVEITDGHLEVLDAVTTFTPSSGYTDEGDLLVEDDFEAGGNLSIAGDLSIVGMIFSDDYTRIVGNLSVMGDMDVRRRIFDGLEPALDILDDLSVSQAVTVWGGDLFVSGPASDGTFRFRNNTEQLYWDESESRFHITDDLYSSGVFDMGGRGTPTLAYNRIASSPLLTPSGLMNASNDLYVEGDIEIGEDLSLGADVTIGGVVFSDDYTQILSPVTVMGDLDVRGRVLDGIGPDIDIVDNMTVSDDFTVVGSTVYLSGDQVQFSGSAEQFSWDAANDDFRTSDDLYVDGVLTSTGGALLGDDATDIFSVTSSGLSVIRDGKLYDSGDAVDVQDDLSPSGDLSVYGGAYFGDTTSDTFILISSGLNITQEGTLSDQSGHVRIYDDLSVTGEVSINENLLVYGTGLSRFSQGRVYIASDDPTILAQQSGDLYVQNDVEIGGNLRALGEISISGELSVAGELQATLIRGTITDSFTIDLDDTTDTPTLAFEDIDGDETFRWNDLIRTLEFSDDLSVGGALTLEQDMLVLGSGTSRFRNGRVYIADDQPSTIAQQSGDLYIQNDMEIGGDLSLGGDVTIVGVVFSDDYTQIIGSLTVSDDVDVRGRIFDGGGVAIDVFDDLSVSGEVTVWGSDIYIGASDTTHDRLRFSSDQQYLMWQDTNDYFELSNDLSIAVNMTVEGLTIYLGTTSEISDANAYYTQISPQNDHLVVRDGTADQFFLVYDSTGNEYVSLDMSQNPDARLLVSNGNLYIQTQDDQDDYLYFTTVSNEPYIGTAGSAAFGINTEANAVYLVNGEELYVDTDTLYADATNDRVVIGATAGTHKLEVVGTAEVSDDLTVSGSDIDLGSGSGALHVGAADDEFGWDSARGEFSLTDDLSVSGRLTVPGVIRIGYDQGAVAYNAISTGLTLSSATTLMNDANDLYIGGDFEVGGDLSLGGDVTIQGVIFSDDYTQFMNPLTITGDLDVRGRIFDGVGPEVDILDDLSISGDLTVWGSDIYLGISDGVDDMVRFSGDQEYFMWDATDNYFELSSNVSIADNLTIEGRDIYLGLTSQISDDDANFTQISPQNDHLVVRDGTSDQYFLVYDSTGTEYVSLDMSQNPDARLLVSGGDLFIQTQDDQDDYLYFTTVSDEPYLGTAGSAVFGINTDGNAVYIADGDDLYVDTDTLYVDAVGNRVAVGALPGTHKFEVLGEGSFSDDLTVSGGDIHVGSATGTVHFDDDSEQFLWESAADEFQLTDDLSIAGGLTVLGNTQLGDTTADTFILVSSGLNILQNGTMSNTAGAVRIYDDLSVTGELSIGADLTVEGTGVSRFSQGRVYVGSTDPSTLAQQNGDLYIEQDWEIGGDLSIGHDITIVGVIFADDYTQVTGPLTVSDDLDVRGRIFDGAGVEVDMLDDLSVSGDVTIWGSDIFVGGTNEDAYVRFSADTEQLTWDEAGHEFEITDDLYLSGVLIAGEGAVFGDVSTDIFAVTSSGLNIAEDGGLFDEGGEVEVRDSLSASGALTVARTLRVGNVAGAVAFNAIDADSIIASSPSLMNAGNDLYVEGDVELISDLSIGGEITLVGIIFTDDYTEIVGSLTVNEDLDVRGRMYDGAAIELDVVDDLSISGDLSVWEGHLYMVSGASDPLLLSNQDMRMNPTQGGPGVLNMGGPYEDDQIIINTDTTVSGNLSIGGDLSIYGAIFGSTNIVGTSADSFTLDTDDDTTTPTLVFEDSDGDESFRWNDNISAFELSHDLSMSGDLTLERRLIVQDVEGGGRSRFVGVGHTVEISDGHLEIYDTGASFTASNGFTDEGDLVVQESFEIGDDLSIGGDITIRGVIFSDDYTEVIGSLIVDNDMDVRGNFYDGLAPELDVGEDLSVAGDLTVWGADIFIGAAEDGHIRFRTDTEYVGWDESETEFEITDDVFLPAVLTTSGGAVLGNDTGDVLAVTSSGLNIVQDGELFDRQGVMEVRDSLSASGDVTASRTLRIGTSVGAFGFNVIDMDSIVQASSSLMNTPDDLYVEDDIEVGSDLSLGGDVTIVGVIFSDDYTQIIGSLTVRDDLDVRGSIYDGIGVEVDMFDDLSVSGEVTVWGSDIYIGSAGGDDDILRFSSDQEYLMWDEANNYFELSSDMSVGANVTVEGGNIYLGLTSQVSDDDSDYTQISPQNDHLVVRDGASNQFFLVYDSTGNEYVSLDISQNPDARLLVSNGDLYIQTQDDQDDYLYFTTAGDEPYIGTAGSAAFGINTEANAVYLVNGEDLYVDTDTLYADATNDRVVIGATAGTHTLEVVGTAEISDDLTVTGTDIYLGSGTGTVHVGSDQAQFLWDTATDEFGLTDDLSVAGDVTVSGSTRLGDTTGDSFILISSGLNIAQNGTITDTDTAVRMYDDVSITGELSVNDDLTIRGSGVSRFRNGRVYIGSTDPSILAEQTGDLYVGEDMEILRNLSVGGDMTVSGTVSVSGQLSGYIEGTTSDIFTIDFLDTSDTPTLAFEDSDGDETLRWNDLISSFELSEDLSIGGALTTEQEIIIEGSGLSRFRDGRVYIGSTDPSTIAQQSGDLYVEADTELGGNLSVGGDMTIVGVIFSDDYTQVMGPLTIGDDLDVRGRMFDGLGVDIDILDDLSVSGDLTVWSDDIYVGYANADGRLRFRSDTEQILWDEAGNEFEMTDDLYVDGVLTTTGGAEIGNDTTDIFAVQSSGLNVAQDGGITDTDSAVELHDSLSISGGLTVSRTLRIGNATGSVSYNAIDDDATVQGTAGLMNARNDLYIEDDMEVGQNLSLGGDVTIRGVIFSDDYTEIIGSLTVGDDIDVRGDIFDGAGLAVDFDDDLSISGNTTIDGALFVADNTVADDSDGLLNLGRNNAAWESFSYDDTEDAFTVSAGLRMERTGVSSITMDDGTSRSDIHYDDEALGFHIGSNVSISDNLTVMQGYISAGQDMTLNAAIGGSGLIELGGLGENDLVEICQDMTVSGYVTVGGDVTVGGIIYGTHPSNGTDSDTYTIDLDDTTDTPTIGFFDSDGDEYLRWNDLVSSFELSDDLSIGGDLTVERRLVVQAAGDQSFFSGADHTVEISDGYLEIIEAGGPYAPSSASGDDGDLFVGDDFELGGSLSIGGDLTIFGVVFSDDYTGLKGNLTVDGDIDVRGRIFDGAGPEVDIFDDLSVSGVLTAFGLTENDIEGYMNLGTATSANNQGDLAMSGELTIESDRITFGTGNYISDTDPDYTQWVLQNGHLELRDDASDQYFLAYDSTGTEYVSLDMSQNPDARLLVSGGDLFIQTQDDQDDYLYFTTTGNEPYISTVGGTTLRIDTDGDAVRVMDGDSLYVDTDTLYVDGANNRVGIGTAAMTHNLEVDGTAHVSDDFTVSGGDVHFGTGSADVHFDDRVEQFTWNDTESKFEIENDISMTGVLTVSDVLRIGSAQDAHIFNVIDIDQVEYYWPGFMDAPNDLYVEGDIEILQHLTVGGDVIISGFMSISGEVELSDNFIDGTTSPTFTIDVDDTTDRPTLGFFDSDGDEYLRWNDDLNATVQDGIDSFEISEDLSMAGSLTMPLDLLVEGSDFSRFTNGRVFIGSDDPSTMAQQNGDLYVSGDVEINRNVSIGGNTTITGVIFSDDYTEIIGDLIVNGDIDVPTYIYDGADTVVDVDDDLSISGDLTVWAPDVYIGDAGGDDDTVRFEEGNEQLSWNESASEFALSDDLSVSTEITVGGILRVGFAQGGANYHAIDMDGVVQGTSGLMDSADDLYVEGDVEVGSDVSIGGDITIVGVIFSDDHTEIIGSLTTGTDIDVRGDIFDGAGVAIDIVDDLSVSGDVTVWGSDIFLGVSGGDDDRLRFSADTEYFHWDETSSLFELSDDLSTMGNLTITDRNIYLGNTLRVSDNSTNTVISPQNAQLVLRDGVSDQYFLVYDSTGGRYVSLDMSQNPDARLLVSNGDLYIQTNDDQDDYIYFTTVADEPYISTVGGATLRVDTDGNAVRVMDGDSLYVDTDTLYVDSANNRVGIGTTAVTHELEVDGSARVSNDFTVSGGDIYLGSGTGTFHLDDDTEEFRWNSSNDTFEITDDLSTTGDLTVQGSTRLGDTPTDEFVLISSGLNITQNGSLNDTSAAVRIDDDLSVPQSLSVNDTLTVRGSGLSRFENGRVYVASTNPSILAQQSGDLFVENDMEIGGLLSIGTHLSVTGDLSVAGVIEMDAEGTDSPTFTIDMNDTTDTPTLAFEDSDGDEIFRWNDTISTMELSDDLSMSRELTVEQDILVTGSGFSRLSNGRLYIGSTDPSTIAQDSGDLYVEEDMELGGNLSIGGDVTIIGVIFSDDYTQIIGSLTVGDDMDVRGRIFDGGAVEVDVLDDLSIAGELTVWGSDIYIGSAGGDDDSIRFSGDQQSLTWDEGLGTFELSAYLTLPENITVTGGNLYLTTTAHISDDNSYYTQISPQNDHLVVRDGTSDQYFLVYDSTGNEYVSLDMSQNPDARLLVSNGDLIIQTQDDQDDYLYFTMDTDEPYIGTAGGAAFGINTESNEVHIVSGETLYVDDDTLYVEASSNRVSIGGTAGTHKLEVFGVGQVTDLTVDGTDVYFASGDASIHVGGAVAELSWDDANNEFDITDDLSIAGNLTVPGILRGGFGQSRLTIDEDVEIGGDLSVGGDATIGGVIFSAASTEIVGSLTTAGDLDVRGRIFDGVGIEVDIDDDLSVFGHATIDGTLFVANDTTAADSDGLFDFGRSSAAWEYLQWDDTQARFELSDDLLLEDAGVVSIAMNDGTATASLSYDDENYGFHMPSNVSVSDNLTVDGGYIASGADATLNPVIDSAAVLELGETGENDTIQINGDATASGDVTVLLNLTIDGVIHGGSDDTGTEADTFNIDTDDSTDTPTLIFADSDGDEYFRWNDLISSFELSHDLSLGGDLTLERRLIVQASGDRSYFSGAGHTLEISDGHLEIYEGGTGFSPSTQFSGDGDLAVDNDMEIGSDLSIGGDVSIAGVIFSDDYTQIMGDLTVNDDIDVRGRIFDGAGPDVDFDDDLSVSGTLNIDGEGESDIEGYINLGTATSANNQGDLAMSGEMTIEGDRITFGTGNYISDKDPNYTQWILQNAHLEVRDDASDQYFLVYDSTGTEYVSLDMSQNPDARLLVSGGDLYIQTNDDQDDYLYFTTATDEPYISTAGGTDLRIDTDGNAVRIMDGDSLYVDTDTLYVDGTNDRVGIGTAAVTHTIEVDGTARFSNDLTVSGGDVHFGASTATIHFDDDSEQLIWDDTENEFELTDDLTIAGDLSAWGSIRLGDTPTDTFILISSGLNIAENGTITDTDTAVIISDDVSVTGELSVNDDLTVSGSGASGFDGGYVHVGTGSPSNLVQQSGDLYIEHDVVVGGSLSVGTDMTIEGIIFAGDYMMIMNDATASQDVEIYGHLYDGDDDTLDVLDDLSVSGDLTVWGRDIYVGGTNEDGWLRFSNDTEQIFWDESDTEFEITEDMFVSGDLTLIGGGQFGNDTTDYFVLQSNEINVTVDGEITDFDSVAIVINDDLSVNGDLTIPGAYIYSSLNDPIDLGATTQSVVRLVGDLRVINDMTISGNLSVSDFPDRWVEETGDTMTGALAINTGGSTAIDLDGDIEYTGALRNQSPVNVADGLAITNLGGIHGGQLLLKDVIIAMADDMFMTKQRDTRTLTVPQIIYLRFAEKKPAIEKRQVEITIDIGEGEFELPLASHEHIIRVERITCPEAAEYFITNVGIDGEVEEQGDFKVRGQRTVIFAHGATEQSVNAVVHYVCRVDCDEAHVVELSIDKQTMTIDDGWQIVYIREEATEAISPHDTAAMSPRTTLVLNVVPIHEFTYSADTVVIGVVAEDGTVNQYF